MVEDNSNAGKIDPELKPFLCSTCGKGFSKNSNLIQHERIHTGEKPYPCTLCGSTFRQMGNLTKHMRSHENSHLRWNRTTTEKPFKCGCEGCDRSFTANSSLQLHIKQAHPDIGDELFQYRCHYDNCAMGFHRKVDLKGHLATVQHDSLPPKKIAVKRVVSLICHHPNCNSVFNDKASYHAHINSFNPTVLAENETLKSHVEDLLIAIDSIIVKNKSSNITMSLDTVNKIYEVKEHLASVKPASVKQKDLKSKDSNSRASKRNRNGSQKSTSEVVEPESVMIHKIDRNSNQIIFMETDSVKAKETQGPSLAHISWPFFKNSI